MRAAAIWATSLSTHSSNSNNSFLKWDSSRDEKQTHCIVKVCQKASYVGITFILIVDNGLVTVEKWLEGHRTLFETGEVIIEDDDQKISDELDNIENEEEPIRSKCMGVLV